MTDPQEYAKVYEPEVSCGQYCQGGSVYLNATDYADESCVVKWVDFVSELGAVAADYDAAFAEIARLKAELEMRTAERDVLNGIACSEEQANGAGPCGVCKNCLRAEIADRAGTEQSLAKNLYDSIGEVESLKAELAKRDRVVEAARAVRDFYARTVDGRHYPLVVAALDGALSALDGGE